MRRARLLIAVVLAGVAGYLAVQAALGGSRVADRGRRGESAAAPTDLSLPPPAAATGDGRSALGAVAAASRYLRLLDQAAPAAISSLRALTLEPLRTRAAAAEATAIALERGLTAPAFTRGWRLGWRVMSSSHTSATVAIWTVGVLDSPREMVSPGWSTTVCSLRWWGGRWMLTSARTVPGPTPPSNPSDPVLVARFARAAAALHPFDDAP